jgi:signal transduction histidine kinase
MFERRRVRLPAVALAARALLVLQIVAACAQEPTCFASLQGDDQPLARQLGDQPDIVIPALLARLAPGAPPQPQSRARLYAMLSDAYGVKGDVRAGREAALAGLAALTSHDGEPLRRRLRLNSIYYLGESGQVAKAASDYEAAAALVPSDAPDLACVLEIRGYMRIRSERIAEAASDLVRAAQLAKHRGSERYQLDAESVLSMLYAKYGLYEDANALVSRAIAASLRTEDKFDMANAYFRRGDVYLLEGDFAAAEPDFRLSAALSRSLGQPAAAAQADERLCSTLSRTNRFSEARETCISAVDETTAAHDPESTKLAYAGLGQISFGESHFREALAYLNRALRGDGTDIPPSAAARLRKLRSAVRAQLRDSAGALEDMTAYLAWVEKEGSARNVAQVAMARAKFDAAIGEQTLGRMRAEAAAARLAETRQRLLANLFLLAAALIVSTGVSGWWLWRRRQELARVTQATEERFAAVGRLTAGIAHEFNNQMTVVQHALSLLARRPAVGADPTARMLIGELQQSTDTSVSITAKLKSFGRQQNLAPERVMADSLRGRIGPTLAKAAGDRVQVHFDIPSPPPVLHVDERPLTEALINLVSNARDAMPKGGNVTIRIEPGPAPFTTIRVIDAGEGMSAGVLARASEPFFTTKPVGSGTGLGLSMVEGFVTQSGGSISIDSHLGRGTTVTLLLPSGRVTS